MKILWLSTETTGTNYQADELIEISGFFEINHQIQNFTFDFKVKPSPSTLDTYLTQDYAIYTRKDFTSSEFKPHDIVYNHFIKILDLVVDKYDKNDKLYLASFNTPFHFNFIKKLFKDNDNHYFGTYFNKRQINVQDLAITYEYKKQKQIFPDLSYKSIFNTIPLEIYQKHHLYNEDLPTKIKNIKITHDILFQLIKK